MSKVEFHSCGAIDNSAHTHTRERTHHNTRSKGQSVFCLWAPHNIRTTLRPCHWLWLFPHDCYINMYVYGMRMRVRYTLPSFLAPAFHPLRLTTTTTTTTARNRTVPKHPIMPPRSHRSPSLTVVLAADEVVVLQLTLLFVRVGGAADDEPSAPTDSDRSMMAAAGAATTAAATVSSTPASPSAHQNTHAKRYTRNTWTGAGWDTGPVCPLGQLEGGLGGAGTFVWGLVIIRSSQPYARGHIR